DAAALGCPRRDRRARRPGCPARDPGRAPHRLSRGRPRAALGGAGTFRTRSRRLRREPRDASGGMTRPPTQSRTVQERPMIALIRRTGLRAVLLAGVALAPAALAHDDHKRGAELYRPGVEHAAGAARTTTS